MTETFRSTKTALVLGATGGIGWPVALRLATRGWKVRALHRDPESVETLEPIEWIQGDALVPEDVARAAQGVPIIVHAETLARRDVVPTPPIPFVMGLEIVGTVAAIGEDAEGFTIGQPLAAFSRSGYAQLATVPYVDPLRLSAPKSIARSAAGWLLCKRPHRSYAVGVSYPADRLLAAQSGQDDR